MSSPAQDWFTQNAPAPAQPDWFDQNAPTAASAAPPPAADGETTNPKTGNYILTPKDGESYPDFLERVAARGKATSNAEVQKSAKQAVSDTPTVLAAAPAIGAAGAAIPTAASMYGAAAVPAAKALGQWVSANPVKAYLAYQALKDFLPKSVHDLFSAAKKSPE